LDLSEIAPNVVQDVGDETTLLLKEILDRIDMPPVEEIPGKEKVDAKGLTDWTVPNTAIRIVKVVKGPREGEFLFSTNTVAKVRKYYDRVGHLPYKPGASIGAYEDYIFSPGPMIPQQLIRSLPDWTKIGLYGQAIWQWIALLIMLCSGAIIILMVFRWSQPRHLGADEEDEALAVSKWSWRKLVFPITWMLLTYMIEHFVDEQINITGNVLKFTKIFLRAFFLLPVAGSLLCSATVSLNSSLN
jgi:MscS family membrane protein